MSPRCPMKRYEKGEMPSSNYSKIKDKLFSTTELFCVCVCVCVCVGMDHSPFFTADKNIFWEINIARCQVGSFEPTIHHISSPAIWWCPNVLYFL